MTDEEVRAIIMAGVNVEYSITMRERTRLHILPEQVKEKFLKALDRYLEGKMWETLDNKWVQEWQRVHRLIGQAEE